MIGGNNYSGYGEWNVQIRLRKGGKRMVREDFFMKDNINSDEDALGFEVVTTIAMITKGTT